MTADETRRARRYDIPDTIQVVDTMTGAVVGGICNLSETGMMLIASEPLVDDALYQLRFHPDGGPGKRAIEVGAHLLWQDGASAPGQTWVGFRFIKVFDDHAQPLRHWLDTLGPHGG